MTKKSKQILPDTVVIVAPHEIGCWESLCNAYQVVVPAIIFENEAFYFDSDRGKVGMNPTRWIEQGKVNRIEATLADLDALQNRLSSDFIASLDPGELEALALILSKHHKDLLFTTADRAAIKALGILGLGYRGISMEELLKSIGVTLNEKLRYKFTKKWFQQSVAEGLSESHLWLKSF